MEFEGVPDYIEDAFSSIRANPPKEVVLDKSGYLSGADILDRSLPSGTKTQYYIDQAENKGNTDTIEQYIEPIGFEILISKTTSWWLNITKDTKVYAIDLSQLRLLAQGSQMGKISGGHDYELFAVGDRSLASEYESKMKEQLDEVRAEIED